MKLVVVGGHSRNVGKTALAAAIVAATRELGWTAIKLTQYGHHMCSADGRACECSAQDSRHPFAVTREESLEGRSDTSRFLAAGAREAWWVRVAQGRLAEAMPALRRLLEGKPYVILESNSVLRFLRPVLYLMVLDWDNADFKTSARDHLDRADAFVQLETARPQPCWEGIPLRIIHSRPVFRVRPPAWWTAELESFVRERLG